jgi:hypothetical protein
MANAYDNGDLTLANSAIQKLSHAGGIILDFVHFLRNDEVRTGLCVRIEFADFTQPQERAHAHPITGDYTSTIRLCRRDDCPDLC